MSKIRGQAPSNLYCGLVAFRPGPMVQIFLRYIAVPLHADNPATSTTF
ncbi:hypothetical protein [Kocuria marina]